MVIHDNPDTEYGFTSAFLIAGTSTVSAVLFIPKVIIVTYISFSQLESSYCSLISQLLELSIQRGISIWHIMIQVMAKKNGEVEPSEHTPRSFNTQHSNTFTSGRVPTDTIETISTTKW